MSIELLITDDNKGFFLEILSSYLQLAERQLLTFNKVKEPTKTILKLTELPLLTFANGDKIVEDELKIAEVLARLSGFYEVIFGKTNEEIKANFDFIQHLKENLQSESKAVLEFLNKHLLHHTFCTGYLVNVATFMLTV